MAIVKQFSNQVNPQPAVLTPQAGVCNTRPDSQGVLSPRIDYLSLSFTVTDLQALRAVLVGCANLVAPPPRDNWPAPLKGRRLTYSQQKKAYRFYRSNFQKFLDRHANLQWQTFTLLEGQPYKVSDAHYFPNRIESAYPISGGYDSLPDGRFKVFLRFSGGFFDALDLPGQKDFLLICDSLADAKISRIDVALDDFSMKTIPYDAMLAAARVGDCVGFRKSQLVLGLTGCKNREETLYLGSRESRSFWRVYWKCDRLRLEREIKGDEAHASFKALADFAKDSYPGSFLEWVGTLARLSIAGLDFVVRSKKRGREKNLSRCERLAWWSAFIDLIGEGLRLVVPRVAPSPEKALAWIDRQVAGTLAALRKGLGPRQFYEWLMNRITNRKLTRQNERLLALMRARALTQESLSVGA